jgi:hypothetical protein
MATESEISQSNCRIPYTAFSRLSAGLVVAPANA